MTLSAGRALGAECALGGCRSTMTARHRLEDRPIRSLAISLTLTLALPAATLGRVYWNQAVVIDPSATGTLGVLAWNMVPIST